MTEAGRPDVLSTNAWTGSEAVDAVLPARTSWTQQKNLADPPSANLAAPILLDDRDWKNPEVGWGLVLPDNDNLSNAERSTAIDAPPAIARLVESRPGSVILRWRSACEGFLRRYYPDHKCHDLSIRAPTYGIADGCIPHYLLIYASPQKIPWSVQYALNMSTYVGRIDLTDQALDQYVAALMNDWADVRCKPASPVVWSVDHGAPDITWLMARAIGDKVWKDLNANSDLTGRRFFTEANATVQMLADALVELTPALIVTTSHGMTGPIGDLALLKSQLGGMVDANHAVVRLESLNGWKPAGAIWYAHACCSAGSDFVSRYAGLFEAASPVASLLDGVAKGAGAMVAPLPRMLLGSELPLRAFVGHVEPTFDWTLRDTANKQVVTHALTSALGRRLYAGYERNPIGWALQTVFREAGAFFADWCTSNAEIDKNLAGSRDRALYNKLVAMDRQTTVIIGDPTVSLAPMSIGVQI